MQNRKNNNAVIFEQIDNCVGKAFNDVFACSFISCCRQRRIPLNTGKSGINLQQEVMPQALPLFFIPEKCFS